MRAWKKERYVYLVVKTVDEKKTPPGWREREKEKERKKEREME